jgi:hypothetical protein
LDSATTEAEAETAAKAFVKELRSRKVTGYDFTGTERSGPAPRQEQASAPPPAYRPPPTKAYHEAAADPGPVYEPARQPSYFERWAAGICSRVIGLLMFVAVGGLCSYCSGVMHAFSRSHPIEQHASTPLIQPYAKPVQGTRDNPIKVPGTTQAEIDAWVKKYLTYDHWYQTQDGQLRYYQRPEAWTAERVANLAVRGYSLWK